MIPGPVLVGIALVVAIFAGRAYYKSISRNGTKEQRFIERAKKKMCFMDEGSLFPKYPHSVKVYYDPKNPKKAVCPEEATELAQSQICSLNKTAATITAAAACKIFSYFPGLLDKGRFILSVFLI